MLTIEELNDIRERVRLDRAEDERIQKRFGRRRPTCGDDREKLLKEVDRLNTEVSRLNALCDALDAARDKAFARLDNKAAAFMAENLADQSGSAPQAMLAPQTLFPGDFFDQEYPEVPNEVFRPARTKPDECPTCGYNPCQCERAKEALEAKLTYTADVDPEVLTAPHDLGKKK